MSVAALIHRSRMGRKAQAAEGTLVASLSYGWSDFDFAYLIGYDNGIFTTDRDVSSWITTSGVDVGTIPITDGVISTNPYNAANKATLQSGETSKVAITNAINTSQTAYGNTILVKQRSATFTIDTVTETPVDYRIDIEGYYGFGKRLSFSASAFDTGFGIAGNSNQNYRVKHSTWITLQKVSNKIQITTRREKVNYVWDIQNMTKSSADYTEESVVNADMWNNYQHKIIVSRIFGPIDINLYKL